MTNHSTQFTDETIYRRLNQLIDRLDNHTFSRLNDRDATMVNHVRKELQQISNMLYLARQGYAELPDLAATINNLLEQSHSDIQQSATITPEMDTFASGFQAGIMAVAQECGVVSKAESKAQ